MPPEGGHGKVHRGHGSAGRPGGKDKGAPPVMKPVPSGVWAMGGTGIRAGAGRAEAAEKAPGGGWIKKIIYKKKKHLRKKGGAVEGSGKEGEHAAVKKPAPVPPPPPPKSTQTNAFSSNWQALKMVRSHTCGHQETLHNLCPSAVIHCVLQAVGADGSGGKKRKASETGGKKGDRKGTEEAAKKLVPKGSDTGG